MADSTTNTQVPTGMVVVSKDEFFAAVGPLDVHPHNHSPDYTTWELRGSRHVVGRSLPGWKNPGDPAVYMLARKRA